MLSAHIFDGFGITIRWKRPDLTAEPRSIYLLRGPARTEWERRFPNSTGSKRLNISARQDRPLLAAQKREQYFDPLM